MIPNEFEYHSPSTLDEAIKLLAEYDEAKLIAGGHSLLPMMKLRFAEPTHLIDINGIEELRGIREENGLIKIGAMMAENELIASSVITEKCPLISEDNIMKHNLISSAIMLVVIFTSSIVNMTQAETIGKKQDNIHLSSTSSDLSKSFTKVAPSTCKVDSIYVDTLANQSRNVEIDKTFPASLEYFNNDVKGKYNSMRDKVISYVKTEVVMSLFNFNVNGFAPENIAAYASKATKPFLPFKFANGVRIIDVKHKDGTIVFKAEIPMHKNHNHALLLIKAAIASATTTICNDSTLVENLLEREVVIQYDYYDSNGVFMCSFNIKDGHSKQIYPS